LTGRSSWMLVAAASLGMMFSAAIAQLNVLDAERAKNLGIAYLEQEKPKDAARMFNEVIALAPDEPLGYANLAAAHLRLSQVDSALFWLDEAARVSPDDPHVQYLTSEAYAAASQWSRAIQSLDRAIELASDNAVARFARVRAMQSSGDSQQRASVGRDLEALVGLAPHNPVVRLKYARDRAEAEDFEAARASFEQLSDLLEDANVPPRVVTLIQNGLDRENAPLAARGFIVLENVLRPSERYKQALETLQPPVIGLPLQDFSDDLKAAMQSEAPEAIRIGWEEAGSLSGESGDQGSIDLADVDGDGIEDLLVSVSGGVSRLWQSSKATGPEVRAVAWEGPGGNASRFIDYDNDGVFDLAIAGENGLRLFRGDSTGTWTDQTAVGAWSRDEATALAVIDFDNEGDLDLIVGNDSLRTWQNRGDGRFRNVDHRTVLTGVDGVRQIMPIDHDDDDDPDLVVLDGAGRLRFFDNVRLSRFVSVERGLGDGTYDSVHRVDFDNNGDLDLLTVSDTGRLELRVWGGGAYAAPLALVDEPADQIAVGDVDNDGWSDLVATEGSAVYWLRNDGAGGWDRAEIATLNAEDGRAIDVDLSDLDGDGDLDVLVLAASGRIVTQKNNGGNANRWLRVSLVGLQTRGTKNNVHGLGSRVEVKAGLHYQVLYADRPVTHFGLGGREQADLIRVTWSNGVPQNVFQPSTNQTIREKQVLKGSCPYLYVWDGERFQFVTDLLGAAPLGLQLADGVIAPDNPREIVKVDAELMKARDGAFEFQFTEELWETIYLDEVGLWVVDHPSDVEAFADERFVPPPYADLEVVTTRGRIYPERATNTEGNDVADRLLAYDYRYPNDLTPTRYQGLVEPHVLNLGFGDVSRLANPTLVMRGWVFWTDTSINVNLSQGEAVRPDFPMVDVWQNGVWVTLDRPFGLPKGKDKWMVLDLAGLIDPKDARVRVRTNYQIYYDLAFLTDAVAEPGTWVTRLKATSADLHYSGFAEMVRPAAEGPHLYDYQKRTTLPVWKDMKGLVTRYGDVTDLLSETDDQMVVFTAGDEVTVRFDAAALPELEAGMSRSYFFLSDGWDKDSDRNTIAGETVLPLPFHGMSAYPYPESETYPEAAHRRMIETLTRRIGPEVYRDFVRTQKFSERPEPLPWERTKDIAEGGVE
jgi:tetratricopeptide (TPR) repeat protein